MAANKLSAMVPFAGFYSTWHDAEFDQCLERMFDIEGDSAEWAGPLSQRFSNTIDWHAAQTDYGREYCERFATALGLTVCEFEEMKSPREYNFATDRLFAKFDQVELMALMGRDDVRIALDVVAADMFTSRSGFISFYSADVSTWGDIAAWDHNQLSALLKAAANVILADGDEFTQEKEFDLMENVRCNGAIEEYMWSNTNDSAVMGNRCDKVARYLAVREAR